MIPSDLRRRIERVGFGLVQTIDANRTGRRFLVFERQHGLIVRGHDEPLTLEEVESFVRDFEDDPFTCEPL